MKSKKLKREEARFRKYLWDTLSPSSQLEVLNVRGHAHCKQAKELACKLQK